MRGNTDRTSLRSQETKDSGAAPSVFLVVGVYNALAKVFKHGHREQLQGRVAQVAEKVLAVAGVCPPALVSHPGKK